MLKEVRFVKQHKDERRRRIFSDDKFDLYVWFEEDDLIYGFQLCYDKHKSEKAVTWTKERGFLHENVDDGEITGTYKRTPVLTIDGFFESEMVAAEFFSVSKEVNAEIRDFIYEKLLSF